MEGTDCVALHLRCSGAVVAGGGDNDDDESNKCLVRGRGGVMYTPGRKAELERMNKKRRTNEELRIVALGWSKVPREDKAGSGTIARQDHFIYYHPLHGKKFSKKEVFECHKGETVSIDRSLGNVATLLETAEKEAELLVLAGGGRADVGGLAAQPPPAPPPPRPSDARRAPRAASDAERVVRMGATALTATSSVTPDPVTAAAIATTSLPPGCCAVYTPQLPPAAAAEKVAGERASPMACALHSQSANATVHGSGIATITHDHIEPPSPVPQAWLSSEVDTLRCCVHQLVARPRPLDAALLSFLTKLPGRTLGDLRDRWLHLRRFESLRCPPAAQLEAAVRSAAAKAALVSEAVGAEAEAAGAEAAGAEAAGAEAAGAEAAGAEAAGAQTETGVEAATVPVEAAATTATTALAELPSPSALPALTESIASALDRAYAAEGHVEGSSPSMSIRSFSVTSSGRSSQLASPPVLLVTAPISAFTSKPTWAPTAASPADVGSGLRPVPRSPLLMDSESSASAGAPEDVVAPDVSDPATTPAAQLPTAAIAFDAASSPLATPATDAPALTAAVVKVPPPCRPNVGGFPLEAPMSVVVPVGAQRGHVVVLQMEPPAAGVGDGSQSTDAVDSATPEGACALAAAAHAAAAGEDTPAGQCSTTNGEQSPPPRDEAEEWELTAVVPAGVAPGDAFAVYLPPSDRRGRFESRNDEARGGGKEAAAGKEVAGKEAAGKEAGSAKALKGNFWHRCSYPGCGKMYRNTDAARKHCRQLHSAWLTQIGAGNPSAYCMLVQFAERRPRAAPPHSVSPNTLGQPSANTWAPSSAPGTARALAIASTTAVARPLEYGHPLPSHDKLTAAAEAVEAAAAATPPGSSSTTISLRAIDAASTALQMLPAASPAGSRLAPPPPLSLGDSLDASQPSSQQLLAASLTTPLCTHYEKTVAGARRARSPERGCWLASDEAILSRPQPKRAALPPYMAARSPLSGSAINETKSPAAPLSTLTINGAPSPAAPLSTLTIDGAPSPAASLSTLTIDGAPSPAAAITVPTAPAAPERAAVNDFFDAVRRWASFSDGTASACASPVAESELAATRTASATDCASP